MFDLEHLLTREWVEIKVREGEKNFLYQKVFSAIFFLKKIILEI